MAMLSSVVSLLALAAPSLQDPAQPTDQAEVRRQPFLHAYAYPEDTALLLSWNSSADAPWSRVRDALPRQIAESAIPQLLDSAAQAAHLTEGEADLLRSGSYSFGFVPSLDGSVSTGELPGQWILVGQFDEAENGEPGRDSIVQMLGRITETTPGEDQRIWTTESEATNGQAISFGRIHDLLIAAPDPTVIDAALARIEGTETATRSVLESQRFQQFLDQCGDDAQSDSAFLAAYVDLSRVYDLAGSLVPSTSQGSFRQALEALQLRQVFAMGYIAHDVGTAVFEHTRICFPAPRTGLLSLLTEAPKRLDTGVASFVPADVASFSLFHLDTDKLLDEALVAIESVDADFGAQARGMVQGIAQSNNIDLQEDFFATLGRRVAIAQWSADKTADAVVAWSLRNPLALGKTLRGTSQFKTSVVEGFELYRHSSGLFTIAVGGDDMLISTSESRLRSVIDNFNSPTGAAGHTGVQKLLADAPANTTALWWTDTASLLRSGIALANEYGEGLPPGVLSELDEVLSSLGHTETQATADGEGLSFRSQSTFGTPGIAALVGLTSGVSILGESDPQLALGTPSRRAEFAWRLGEIVQAIGARPADTTLSSLDAEGVLPSRVLDGRQVGANEYAIAGYRVALMRDAETPSAFAVVAWPDEERRGDVFSCTAGGIPMVNEVLTHASGIAKLSPRDVFRDGKPASTQFATGWELINLVDDPKATVTLASGEGDPAQADSPAAVELEGSDWTTYQSLIAAERGDLKLESDVLLELVRHQNPAIAARAAFVIGSLRARDLVPALAEVALELTDTTVRRQTLQTLHDLEDPRAVEVARVSLSDSDATVRAISAAIVGRQRDTQSVQGLLDIVVRSNPTEADVDRTQALLALADIGVPGCVETVAGSPFASPEQEQGIAYVLQQLTPQMESATEVATLLPILSHESTIVRRYAIQRLGELQDPVSETALEHRLGNESAELRPLLEVALSAVRGPQSADDTGDGTAAAYEAKETAETGWRGMVAKARAWARGLDKKTRNIYLASSAGAVFFLLVLVIVVLRRRSRAQATDWAAMAAPSEEFDGEAPLEGDELAHDEGTLQDPNYAGDEVYAELESNAVLDETGAPPAALHDEFYDDHSEAQNLADDAFGTADFSAEEEQLQIDDGEWDSPKQ